MISTFSFRVVILSTIALAACTAHGVTYKATVLHPVGYKRSWASGNSDLTQVGMVTSDGIDSHAALWTGAAASFVDLHPADFAYSEAFATSGEKQVGFGFNSLYLDGHALLWSGTAESVVDLHPIGSFPLSVAVEVEGNFQVGTGAYSLGDTHALLWNGTAASVVDLHPAGFTTSSAGGISGSTQVGSGTKTGGFNPRHALLWHGTAESVVDLHPVSYGHSFAEDVWGANQVGYGTTGNVNHALLWTGSAASVVNLNPPGFDTTEAHGVSSAGQVGFGKGDDTGGDEHALVWNGTASSVVDLHPFLASVDPTLIDSRAYGISPNGEIVGIGSDFRTGNNYAVLWTPVPEPSSFAFVIGGLAVASLTRARCHCPLPA